MTDEVLKILFVEDNPGDARLVQESMRDHATLKSEVVHVERPEQAVDRLATHDTDVVLLDLGLPGSKGMEILDRLLRHGPKAPVIVLTGQSDAMLGVEAVKAGAQDYLMKGNIDGPHLVQAIYHAIERYQLQAQVQKRSDELQRRSSELARSDTWFRQFTEIATDWFWETDAEGRYSIISDNWGEITGLDPMDMLGKPRRQLIEDHLFREERQDAEKWQAHFDLWDQREPFRDLEFTWPNAGGELRFLSVSGMPMFDETATFHGYRGTGRDVTEQRRAQKQIEKQARDLARSNQELEDFANIVSHDLKEPLRGISNYAQFIKEDYGDVIDEKGGEMLETLPRLAKRLESFLDDLLTYSRVGRTELGVRETDLGEIVHGILDTVHDFIDRSGAEVRIPAPLPTVLCDGIRVGEVFRNLITNSVKYNDKTEGWIEIGCLSEAEDGPGGLSTSPEFPVFYVRDNGIGIAENQQDDVFKIFKRLHGRDKFGGGTGAGLTIVKRIVERHGGQIWLDSEPGKGSTFYFTLSGEQPQ